MSYFFKFLDISCLMIPVKSSPIK